MEEKKKSGFATAGLVLGIIAICFSFIPVVSYVSFVLGALAIIFSIVVSNVSFKVIFASISFTVPNVICGI